MSLYKQPGCRNWYFKIRTKTGRIIRKTTTTEDRDKAQIIADAFRLAVAGNSDIARLHTMLDAVCDCTPEYTQLSQLMPLYADWLKTSGRAIGKRTYENRQMAVHRLTKWIGTSYQSAASIEQIDDAAAAQYARHLADSGLKAKTRKCMIDNLATVWKALAHPLPKLQNPWPRVRPIDTDSATGKPFTREQEKKIMEEAKKAGNGWQIACLIARHTGMRYGSVARLKWSEVDLEAGMIRHTPPKTSRHKIQVRVPLVAALHDALKEARAANPTETYVLPAHARAYHQRTLKSGPGLFAPILTSAGIGAGYTFHSWRHTFRTRLSEAGVSDDIAKRLGGWTKDATAARYDHAERAAEIRAAIESAT